MDTCKFEDKIIKMLEDISSIKSTVEALDKRINGSMDAIQNHIRQGITFRTAIICACIGLLGSFGFTALKYGQVTAQVEDSAREIEILRAKTGVDNARMERSITALENKK